MSEKRQVTAAASVLAVATLLSRCAGLIRDVVVATLFGAGFATDAFFVAFTIPNLLRRFFAEGSLTAAFVPIFSQIHHEEGHAQAVYVARQCWTLLIVVMATVTAAGILLAPVLVHLVGQGFETVPGKMALTIELTRLMFPYIFFVSLLAFMTGILNVYGHFFIPALSPLVLNLCMIGAALCLGPCLDIPVGALAWGVLLGGVSQLAMTWPVVRRYGFQLWPAFHWRHAAVRKIARLMLPGIAGVAIYQINVVVTRLLSSFLAQGSVSWLYYSQRLMEFPQGIFVVSLAQAVLPTMSRHAARGDRDGLLESLSHALKLILLVTIPAAAGLVCCAEPLFSLLFMRGAFEFSDVQQTATALVAYAPGLVFVGISRVVVPVFHARQNTRTPVWISFWTLLINAGLGLLLMRYWAHTGLAWALTLSSLFNAVLLLWQLRRQLGPLRLSSIFSLLVKILAATALMTLFVQWMLQGGDWRSGLTPLNLIFLLAAVAGGVGLYGLVCFLLGIDEIRSLSQWVNRKLHRSG
ncbi:MAG: murein biosynthesis integral membrane protein MurJ [Desulfuromonadaceae bacterium]|nr:murein biosynthesis integral membrane protein MurJ [Desulfuromonadaceae bacterium]